MRVPNAVHEAHPWVVAQIAPDFTLLDVWDLPAEGGAEDFDDFLAVMRELDPAEASLLSKLLFAVRRKLGAWFGWDEDEVRPIPGRSETSLIARLPEYLRGTADGTVVGAPLKEAGAAIVPLYRTDDEWAAEIGNATVHGVLHVAWVEQSAGRYRARLAIYVKPRGRLGRFYLALIGPFRHLVVYPALTRQIGRAWDAARA